MKGQKVLFSKKSNDWATPEKLYGELNSEFKFDFDPCPLNSKFDGLKISWKKNNFVNPPYSNIKEFVEKGYQETFINKNSELCVFLLPARTDTRWFHHYFYKKPYVEIRFIKGRLKFGGGAKLRAFSKYALYYGAIA